MSKDKLELISALVDDELDQGSRFILHALQSDEEGKSAWGRYHLIGECLRGHLPAYVDMRIAARINQSLQDTPFPLTSRRYARMLKGVTGLAIAASVAAVAILGVRHIGSDPAVTAMPPVAYQPPDIQRDYPPVAVTAGTVQEQPAGNFSAPDNAQSRLNRYLVNYNEYRANAGVQGTLPYVRIVAHEVEE